MHLSTSSSKVKSKPQWLIIYTISFCLSCLAFFSYNYFFSHKNYRASVADTKDFWSLQRAKVYTSKKPLVFLGASRTLYGIDVEWIKHNMPNYSPIMLAINGHYPLASLKDLAEDKNFKGIVIVDIDSRGLLKANQLIQQYYVDHFNNTWSPNKYIHQSILSQLQSEFVSFNADFSLLSLLKRYMAHQGLPAHKNDWMQTSRNANLDLTQTNNAALADYFYDVVKKDLIDNPPPSPKQWFDDAKIIRQWVSAIQARGGDVIFYTPPVSKRQKSLADKAYPNELYWNNFINSLNVHGVLYEDIAGMESFNLPDESHIDYRDKARYTQLLMEFFKRHDLL